MNLLYHLCIVFIFAPIVTPQKICNGPQNFSDFNLIQIQSALYMTGGNPFSSDIWTLDLTNGLDLTQCPPWVDLQTTDITIQPFMYGVAYATPDYNLIAQTGDGGTPRMINGVKFNKSTNTWAAVNGTGQIPVVRAEMTASLNTTTNQAWYYGGRNTQSQQAAGNYNYASTYNDFYYFDTAANTWNWPQVIYTGGVRPSRFGHTSTLLMDQLFILGGKTAILNGTANSWIVDVADFKSVLVFDIIQSASISMATINDIPPGLIRFSAAQAPDGRSIVIFGGKTLEKHGFVATQTVHVLDTCTLSWSTPNIQGTPPTARAGHEAITIGNYMIVIGGITHVGTGNTLTYANDIAILDMSTWTWVNSIPPNTVTTFVNPGCRFDLRVSQTGDGTNGDDGLPYDSTVISNPNSNDNIPLKEGLGIGFGLFAVLLCGAALWGTCRLLRNDARITSPRWLPGLASRQNRASSTQSRPSTSSLPSTTSDHHLDIKNDVPMLVISEHP